MNHGTEENPYFDIHPGAELRKGVAKEWEKDRIYEHEDLPKDITAKKIVIYRRVKVKRTNQKRKNKMAHTQSQI